VIGSGRRVKRGGPEAIGAAGVEQLGVRVQQATQLVDGAARRCVVERGDQLQNVRRPRVTLLILAHQQLELRVPGLLGDLVHAASGAVRGARVETVLERLPDRLDVPLAGRGEDTPALGGVHGGLERAPARKAVMARDDELRVGKPRDRVLLRAHCAQALLGLVAEVLETGAVGKLWRHGRPSFRGAGHTPGGAPGVRESRAGSQVVATRCPESGLSPLRGPSAPLWAGATITRRADAGNLGHRRSCTLDRLPT